MKHKLKKSKKLNQHLKQSNNKKSLQKVSRKSKIKNKISNRILNNPRRASLRNNRHKPLKDQLKRRRRGPKSTGKVNRRCTSRSSILSKRTSNYLRLSQISQKKSRNSKRNSKRRSRRRSRSNWREIRMSGKICMGAIQHSPQMLKDSKHLLIDSSKSWTTLRGSRSRSTQPLKSKS